MDYVLGLVLLPEIPCALDGVVRLLTLPGMVGSKTSPGWLRGQTSGGEEPQAGMHLLLRKSLLVEGR